MLLQETKDLDDDSIESLEKHRKNLLTELQEEERGPTTSSELEKKTLHAQSKNDVPTSAPIQSKFLSAGTSVSIRHSPYARLPAPESFGNNMNDMELFKNLPNSTGAFRKVKSLLNKVTEKCVETYWSSTLPFEECTQLVRLRSEEMKMKKTIIKEHTF